MSTFLIKLLLAEYAVILVFCMVERNWPRALYWLGAAFIQGAVLWMGKA